MMRRILIVFLAVVLFASLCVGVAVAEKTTIQFWSNLPSENVGIWWGEQIELFEGKYPDIEVKVMFMDGDQLKTKLEAALAAGTERSSENFMFFFVTHENHGKNFIKAVNRMQSSYVTLDT